MPGELYYLNQCDFVEVVNVNICIPMSDINICVYQDEE